MRTQGLRGRLWLRGRFRPGWLLWERGRLTEVEEGEPPRRRRAALQDLGETRILPGLVDTLLHGFAGVDAASTSPEELDRMTRAVAATGTTTALVGLYPLTPAAARRSARAWDGWRRLRGRPRCRVPGWHVEGPFVAPEMRGALPAGGIRPPSARAAAAFVRACGGWLRISTLAPELPGAAEAAAVFRHHGVLPSIGHTACGYEEVLTLAREGPVAITHLGNRMPPLRARQPGPIGAAMAGHVPWTGVIPDGVHVSPDTLALWSRWPPLRERLLFQSDAIAAAGLAALDFRAGGQRLRRDGPVARDVRGGLAGGLDSLFDGLRARIRDGSLDWCRALRGAAEVPGRLLGDCGRLESGLRADLVALDEDDTVLRVWIGGRLL